MSRVTRSDRFILAGTSLAWLMGSASGIAVWVLHIDGLIQHFANLFYLLALPGWIPIYAVGFSGVRDHPLGVLVANTIAWVCWAAIIRIVWRTYAHFLSTRLPTNDTPSDPSRRAFLAHSTMSIGAIGAVASPSYATLIEPWSIKVRQYSVPINGLPVTLDGLRCVQFSDAHLGPRIPASFIRSAVQQVVDLKPDLLLLTGDYIHDNTKDIDPIAKLCKPMIEAARLGAVGVLGNHDWWGDGPRMAKAPRQSGCVHDR